VTRESIAIKQSEDKRLQDINSLLVTSPSSDLATTTVFSRRQKFSGNIFSSLELMRAGIISVGRAEHEIRSGILSNIFPLALGRHTIANMTPVMPCKRRMSILYDPSRNKIVESRSNELSSSTISVFHISQRLNLHCEEVYNELTRENRYQDFNFYLASDFVKKVKQNLILNRILCMCLMPASTAPILPNDFPVMLIGDSPDRVFQGWRNTSDEVKYYVCSYEEVERAIPQCCAFNMCDGEQFAIGTDLGINIGSLRRRARLPHTELATLNTNKAGVLSLCYARTVCLFLVT